MVMKNVEVSKAGYNEKIGKLLNWMRVDNPDLYSVVSIDLATARTNALFEIPGTIFIVTSITGLCSVRLNGQSKDLISLNTTRTIDLPFFQFFITNTAQAGKTMTLLIGRELTTAKAPHALKLVTSTGIDIDPFTPLSKGVMQKVTKLADAAFFAANLSPTNVPCMFRVMVAVTVAGIFKADLINGGTTHTILFNSGIALDADCAYVFYVMLDTGDTINFKTSVGADCTCRVQEIVAGAQ